MLRGEDMSSCRTGIGTKAAANAGGGSVEYIHLPVQGFRIVAPTAGKRTTLEKDGAANAWTVMRRITLDIK